MKCIVLASIISQSKASHIILLSCLSVYFLIIPTAPIMIRTVCDFKCNIFEFQIWCYYYYYYNIWQVLFHHPPHHHQHHRLMNSCGSRVAQDQLPSNVSVACQCPKLCEGSSTPLCDVVSPFFFFLNSVWVFFYPKAMPCSMVAKRLGGI